MSFREINFDEDVGLDEVTVRTPVNIATIKYWGKRDESLNLPLHSSISVTLSMKNMYSETTVKKSNESSFCINGCVETPSKRFLRLIKKVEESVGLGGVKVNVNTRNTFPTAAGLASSASGFAALASAMKLLYKVDNNVSELARLGSGSACRSTQGGFVIWERGVLDDGRDSISRQLVPSNHWPEFRVLVCVVCKDKKSIPSTAGMQRTVQTSALMSHRINEIQNKINLMKSAIQNKDFKTFAQVTMKDSNEMHAVCLDTYPPIMYLNSVSYEIMNFVHQYNEVHGVVAAYTFDAGPNAVLFCEFPYLTALKSELEKQFVIESKKVTQIIECEVGCGPVLKC